MNKKDKEIYVLHNKTSLLGVNDRRVYRRVIISISLITLVHNHIVIKVTYYKNITNYVKI